MTLTLFSDYLCPHCRTYHKEIEPSVMADYIDTGKVRLRLIDYPVIGARDKDLTDDSITQILLPTVDDVLSTGRADLISVGFLLSLWSGSRALNVFVDTISIMYGQSGVRGIVQTRALSFSLYVMALVVGVVTIRNLLLGVRGEPDARAA